MVEEFFPGRRILQPMVSAGEHVYVDERRHGVVLVGAFMRAVALAFPGVLALVVGWPATAVGALLLTVAAGVVVRAVWRWERTRVVLTGDKLFVVHGTFRRRAAAVRLARIGPVEIEQGIVGRLLGYGTIVAGELEITHVHEPTRIVDRLSV
jgi:membrane protein YdbS with pleckstrin-like domain